MGKFLSSRAAGRLLFLSAAIALSTLALYPDLRLPELPPSGKHTDFFYHMVGFLMLTICGLMTMGRSLKMVVAMAALAVILESLQHFVPGRRVFAIDLVASLLGVTFGTALVISTALLRRRWPALAWLR